MADSSDSVMCRRCFKSFKPGDGRWVDCYMGGIWWGKTELCPVCSLAFPTAGITSH